MGDGIDDPHFRGSLVFKGAGGRRIEVDYSVWMVEEACGEAYVLVGYMGCADLFVKRGLTWNPNFSVNLREMMGPAEVQRLLEPADYVAYRTESRPPDQTAAELFAELLENKDPEIRLAAMTALRDASEG